MRHEKKERSRCAQGTVRKMCRQTWPKPEPMHDHNIEPRHVQLEPSLQSRRIGKPKTFCIQCMHGKGIPPDPRRPRGIATYDLVFNAKLGERGNRMADSLGWTAVGGVHAGNDAEDLQCSAPHSPKALAFWEKRKTSSALALRTSTNSKP